MQDIQDEIFYQGFYTKPHELILWVKTGKITKSEYILLDLLIHVENRFGGRKGAYFYRTDESLIATGLISKRTLREARKGLIKKDIIYHKQGYTNYASTYKIKIRRKYEPQGSKFNGKEMLELRTKCYARRESL